MHIEISDTGVPYGVTNITNKLPDPATVNENATIRFSGDEFIYLTGLVLLATWRKVLPPGIVVKLDDAHCPVPNQRFLTNTGFIADCRIMRLGNRNA